LRHIENHNLGGQVESAVKTTDIGNITTCPPKL